MLNLFNFFLPNVVWSHKLSIGLCGMGSMSEAKERIVAEHPKAWAVRMVEGRGLKVAERTLYWWSVHLERFLKFCRSVGAESS